MDGPALSAPAGDDTLPPQTHGNAIAEVVWTVVPTIIVAFLFVVSWQTLNNVDAVSANPETRIRAVAGQFQWQFDYFAADGETVAYTEFIPTYDPTGDVGGMHVPAGRTVQLSLTSTDVIHAFYVPQFLFKRDVVPGRTNMFEFKVLPEDAGQTFRGQCAELCGAGHRVMLFDVRALTPGRLRCLAPGEDRRRDAHHRRHHRRANRHHRVDPGEWRATAVRRADRPDPQCRGA